MYATMIKAVLLAVLMFTGGAMFTQTAEAQQRKDPDRNERRERDAERKERERKERDAERRRKERNEREGERRRKERERDNRRR